MGTNYYVGGGGGGGGGGGKANFGKLYPRLLSLPKKCLPKFAVCQSLPKMS